MVPVRGLEEELDRNVQIYLEQEARYQAEIATLRTRQNQSDDLQLQLRAATDRQAIAEQSHREEVQALKGAVSGLQAEAAQLGSEGSRLQREAAHARSEASELHRTIQRLQEERAKQPQPENSKVLEAELLRLQERNLRLEEEGQAQRSRVAASLDELRSLSASVRSLEAELGNSHHQMDVLHRTILELEAALRAAAGNYETECAELHRRLGSERQETERLIAVIVGLEAEAKDTRNRLDNSAQLAVELRTRLVTQEQNCRELTAQL